MKKIVLNIPNCETDNLFLKAVMQPSVGVLSSGRFSMIYGDQDQLLELTSQLDTLLINATSFASDIPEAFDSEEYEKAIVKKIPMMSLLLTKKTEVGRVMEYCPVLRIGLGIRYVRLLMSESILLL